MERRTVTILVIIVMLLILSFGITSCLMNTEDISLTKFGIARVGVIELKGEIASESQASLFSTGMLTPQYVKDKIKKAESARVDAIIFKINSPGGTVLATKQIGEQIKKIDKPTIAVVDEVGASGGYWIATAADKIVADEMSIVGSIGVISQYLEFSGLMKKYGITAETIKGGVYKDAGSPFKNMTSEERNILQAKVDMIHHYFISEVATNRNLSYNDTAKLATGMFYLGDEAKDMGLIDELGGMDEAEAIIKQQLNVTEIQLVEFKESEGFLQMLSKVFSKPAYYLGQGIGSAIFKAEDNPQITV